MRRHEGDWRIYSKNKEINFALIDGPRSKGAQVKVKATSAGGNGCQSATRIELSRVPPRVASLSPPTSNGRCRNWRLTCPKTIKSFSATPSNCAPFAPESLALFVTTLREPPSAQRGALSTSSPVAKRTAIGCGDYPPPDAQRRLRTRLLLRPGVPHVYCGAEIIDVDERATISRTAHRPQGRRGSPL